MIKPFKIFKGYTYSDEFTFSTVRRSAPPYQLSRRHWNLLPQRLRNGPERDIADYIAGWEARRNNNLNNSHHTDLHRAELWNSGFWDCTNRIGRNGQVDELRERITHGFCAGVHNTQLILHYEGDMDIESVRAMLHDLTYRYSLCVSFTDITLSNMENYLNEHLSGTSSIRLA